MSVPPNKPNNPLDNKPKAKAKLPSLQIPDTPSRPVEEVSVNPNGPTYLHHYINIGGGTPASGDSADEREKQELALLKETPGYKLRNRFYDCTDKSAQYHKKGPDVKELEDHYAEASNADLLSVIKLCVTWINAAANLTIKKNKNEKSVKVAKALQEKWKNLLTKDNDARVEHFEELRKERNAEDLRKMTADAFNDIDNKLAIASGEDYGAPEVKSGSSTPTAGKYWY